MFQQQYTFQMFFIFFVAFLWNIGHMMDDLLPLLGWLKWLAMAPRPAFMTWRQLCLLCSNLTSQTCEYHMSYRKSLQALLAYQTQRSSSREAELSVNSQKCWREFKCRGLWIYENAEKPIQQLAEWGQQGSWFLFRTALSVQSKHVSRFKFSIISLLNPKVFLFYMFCLFLIIF